MAPYRGQPARFYPPRWKLLVYAAVGAVVTLIGYGLRQADYQPIAVLGWILLVSFGAGTLVMILRALRPGFSVEIDDIGIVDRTDLFPTGRVRWEEIRAIRKKELGRGRSSERMLEVILADKAAFMSRPRSPGLRLLDLYRRRAKQPMVFLQGSMVSRPMAAVIEEIRRRRPELQVLELPEPPPRLRLFNRHPPPRSHPRPPRW